MDTKFVQTPPTNRGVERTYSKGLTAGVDWFQGTFLGNSDFDSFCERILGLDPADFTKTDRGMYGWNGQAFYGHIRVLYDPGPNVKGIHLLMGGTACREYEQMADMESMMRRFIGQGVLSRFDIAVDDTFGYYTMETMARSLRRGDYVTRYRKYRIMETRETESNSREGITVYLGSPQSDKQIRFYQKDKERKAKGYEVLEGIKVWNRGEVQLRDAHANNALHEVLDKGIGEVYFGIVANDIRFLKRVSDTNKRRWPVAKWWEKYINEAQKLSIAPKMPESDLVTKDKWIERQVDKALAQIWLATGGKLDRIIGFLESGSNKLSKEDVQKIEEQAIRYHQYLRYKALKTPDNLLTNSMV